MIGIDLGTTNTAASIWRNGESQLIPNRYGEFLTPSMVYVDEKNRLIVGKHAKARLKTDANRVASVFKRAMGSNAEFRLGKRVFSAIELSALIIKVIKDDAENFLSEQVSEAIISVPAYFNDNQRKATKIAAEMAGLTVNRLINEPTAAAMAYGLHEKPEDTQFMVLDLGGGTFDVSIMEYFDGVLEVHASAGDNFLGGEDFLETFVQIYLTKLDLKKSELTPEQIKSVYFLCQKNLHLLSAQNTVSIESIIPDSEKNISIDRDEFERAVVVLLDKMRFPIERSLQDANLSPDDLDQVILVGGATRMPVVSSLVAKLFRKMPMRNLDPDLVVAMGTGIQAGLMAKDEALDDIVLTDVCPYTMGIAIRNHGASADRQGSLFSPIIDRNSIVPVSRNDEFYTVDDDQDYLSLRIFQGESRLVKNNIFLGELKVDVPKNKAGEEAVDVRFSYDMNGLLEIDVEVLSTGEKHNMVIDNSGQNLSNEDIQKSREKLAKIKFHPRDDEVNQHLLFRAEHIYESSLGEQRQIIANAIAHFESILESQDSQEVSRAQKEFGEYLDELEHHKHL